MMSIERASGGPGAADEREWLGGPELDTVRQPVSAWGEDPLAFLLDAIGDPANLWSAQRELLYRNRASAALGPVWAEPTPVRDDASSTVEVLDILGRRFERRYLRCHIARNDYVLEVIRDLAQL